MGSVSFALKCKLQTVKCLTLIGTEGAAILDRIHDHKINRLDELLPWSWAPIASVTDSQAA